MFDIRFESPSLFSSTLPESPDKDEIKVYKDHGYFGYLGETELNY